MANACDHLGIEDNGNLDNENSLENPNIKPSDAMHVLTPSYIKEIRNMQSSSQMAELVVQHFHELLRSKGDWPESIYDLCWAIMTRRLFTPEKAKSEIQKILNSQNPDGTWGVREIAQSSALDTMQALCMFVLIQEQKEDEEILMPDLNKVLEGLKGLLVDCAKYEGEDLVGFELIFPFQLVFLIRNEWLNKHAPDFILDLLDFVFYETTPEVKEKIGKLAGKGAWKIDFFKNTGNLFNRELTLSFSAEVGFFLLYFNSLSDEELAQMAEMILVNGSIGLSPAATAAVAMVLENRKKLNPELIEKLYGYLVDTLSDNDGVLVNLHDIDNSRRLWNVLPWIESGILEDLLSNADESLEKLKYILIAILQSVNVTETGVPWAYDHIMTDLDDTGVRLILSAIMRKLGIDLSDSLKNFATLESFEEADGNFFCYPFEATPSFASLEHAKGGVKRILEMGLPDEITKEARKYRNNLLSQFYGYITRYGFYQHNKRKEAFKRLIQDKWHISVDYFLQMILCDIDMYVNFPEFVFESIAYVLDTQNQDGGWGVTFGSTPEETAYAILGLSRAYDILNALPQDDPRYKEMLTLKNKIDEVLEYAERFLDQATSGNEVFMPPLWISKNVYRANKQVLSSIMAAKYYLLRRKEKPSSDRVTPINPEDFKIIPDENFCLMYAYSIVYRFVLDRFNKDIDYFEDGEKLSGLWGIALGIKDAFYGDANAAFIGIDGVCELIQDEEALVDYLSEIIGLLNYSLAQDFVTNYNKQVEAEDLNNKSVSGNQRDFIEASKYLFAWVVVRGEDKLRSQENGSEKVELWKSHLKRELIAHNKTQYENSKLGFEDQDISDEEFSKFKSGLSEKGEDDIKTIAQLYIEKYKHTGALAPIMLSSIPSADPDLFSPELLDALNEMLEIWTPMLRIAQEIKIDSKKKRELSLENINLLIITYAIIYNCENLKEAKEELISRIEANDNDLEKFFDRFMKDTNKELLKYYKKAEELMILKNPEWGEKIAKAMRLINISLVKVVGKLATPDEVLLITSLNIEDVVMELMKRRDKEARTVQAREEDHLGEG